MPGGVRLACAASLAVFSLPLAQGSACRHCCHQSKAGFKLESQGRRLAECAPAGWVVGKGGLARAVSSHAPGRFDPLFRLTITTPEQNKVVKDQFEQALAATSSRRAEPCCSLLRACTACHPPWNRQLRRVQRRMASGGSGRAGPAGNARAAALLALLLLAATHVQGGGGLGAAMHHPGAAGCTRGPPRPRTHAAPPFPPQAWCWRL